MALVIYAAAQMRKRGSVLAAITASLMLGACGQTLSGAGDLLATGSSTPRVTAQSQAQAQAQARRQAPPPDANGTVLSDTAELQRATEYWGKKYAENSRDLDAALSYARNLKAMGEKRRALSVLQQAGMFHGQSRELAGEYGRLALELDQVSVAKPLLAMADDPARPDWRIVSARGAALAKEGKYNEAIPFFERALTLAHNQPSVMSNLALAYAMNGEPARAEGLLRQAAASGESSPRIRQNLALVLGLQGKYDESTLIASRDLPMSKAKENSQLLQQVVQLDPKPVPNSDPQPVGAPWNADAKLLAEAPVSAAVPVQRVSNQANLPPVDPQAALDEAWVISTDVPSAANGVPSTSHSPVMSVSEMAGRINAD
jgi:Flp pilus assembly protein TadD